MKTCSFCFEEIHVKAIKCRYCHEFLTGKPAAEKISKDTVESKEFTLNATVPDFNQPVLDPSSQALGNMQTVPMGIGTLNSSTNAPLEMEATLEAPTNTPPGMGTPLDAAPSVILGMKATLDAAPSVPMMQKMEEMEIQITILRKKVSDLEKKLKG